VTEIFRKGVNMTKIREKNNRKVLATKKIHKKAGLFRLLSLPFFSFLFLVVLI